MSLKGVHIIFIISAIITAIFFGVWSFNYYSSHNASGYLVASISSFITAVGLSIYCVLFIKKLKKL